MGKIVSLENQKLKTTSIQNARQLGGYKTKDGKTVKMNLLLRTAALDKVSEEDKKLLSDEYKVKSIIDFRSDFERNNAMDCQLPNCVNFPINVLGKITNTGMTKELLEKIHKSDEVERYHLFATLTEMQEIYYGLVTSELGRAGYKKFFEILLNTEDGAVLWHCSQGKDRTGFAGIFLLTALGVDFDIAIKDFGLSNESYKDLTEKVIERAKIESWTEWELENTLAITGVSVKYMLNAIDLLNKTYGSVYEYIRNQLGLTEDNIQCLKNKYLE